MDICGGTAFCLTIDFDGGCLISASCYGRELTLHNTKQALLKACFRDHNGTAILLQTIDAKRCSLTKGKKYFRAVYSGFSQGEVKLALTVREEENGALFFRADAECGQEMVVEWIEYPRIIMKNELKGVGGDGEILWPYNEGVLIDDLSVRESSWFHYREAEYPSQGLYGMYPNMVQSQFLAYLFSGRGLYLGIHDPSFGPKVIDIKPENDGFQLLVRIFSGCDFGQSFHSNFDIVLAPFQGDWYDAAELYRVWFLGHLPEGLLPIAKNDCLPAWYHSSPVVVTYPVRGLHDMDTMTPNRLFPYSNALPVIEGLSEKFGCPILVLLMHWEGTAPWAPPFVWPPFGGQELFSQFADALHTAGNLIGVYCSGMGFTIQSNLIESYNMRAYFEEQKLADTMCLSPQGTLEMSAICTGQRSGYDMCPGSDKAHALMLSELEKILQSNIDYIQVFDQNHGGNSYLCYAKNHRHAPVPGVKQTEEMRALHQSLKNKAGKVLMGCESGAAEPYLAELPFSDNRFNLNFSIGYPVPLYAYLYHSYVNNFMGNQCCTNFEPDEANLLYRLAYSFVAGDMLTLVLTDDGRMMQWWGSNEFNRLPNQEAVSALVANLNRWRIGRAKKYLHFGEMLKPVTVDSGLPHEFVLVGRKPIQVSRILTSRWIAADNSLGQIVVNYSREEVFFKLIEEADKNPPQLYLRDGRDELYTCGQANVLPPLSAGLFIWTN